MSTLKGKILRTEIHPREMTDDDSHTMAPSKLVRFETTISRLESFSRNVLLRVFH